MLRTRLIRAMILIVVVGTIFVLRYIILFQTSYQISSAQMGLLIHVDSPVFQKAQLKFNPVTPNYKEGFEIDRSMNDILVYDYRGIITLYATTDANAKVKVLSNAKEACKDNIPYTIIDGGISPSINLLC